MMKIKQAIIFRKDLPMSPGKMAAQACHAAIGAFECAELEVLAAWKRGGVTKVVLSVPDEAALHALHARAIAAELPAYLVRDEGRTEVEPGSLTALAIGPGYIDPVTSTLPLWVPPQPVPVTVNYMAGTPLEDKVTVGPGGGVSDCGA